MQAGGSPSFWGLSALVQVPRRRGAGKAVGAAGCLDQAASFLRRKALDHLRGGRVAAAASARGWRRGPFGGAGVGAGRPAALRHRV